MEPKLDMRHEQIIELVNDLGESKNVLNVGAGSCKIDYHLNKIGHSVTTTDYQRTDYFDKIMKDYFDDLNFKILDIFKPETFPTTKSEVVICCEVLEHIVDYKTAFKNLLDLTDKRLIITVPHKKAFNMPGPPPIGHCNFWDDTINNGFKDINEYVDMAKPHNVSIEKIITKPIDERNGHYFYLIIIDKD